MTMETKTETKMEMMTTICLPDQDPMVWWSDTITTPQYYGVEWDIKSDDGAYATHNTIYTPYKDPIKDVP